MFKIRVKLVLSLLLLVASRAPAAVFVVPADRDMIRQAPAIVIGTVVDSRSEVLGTGLWTRTTLLVEEVLKGNISSAAITITEPGGRVGNLTLALDGVPKFVSGQRVLLFLEKDKRDEWTSWQLDLGRFDFVVDDAGSRYLLRNTEEICGWDVGGRPHVEHAREEFRFLQYVRDEVVGQEPLASYERSYGDVCLSGESQKQFHLDAAPTAFLTDNERWSIFTPPTGSVSFVTAGRQNGVSFDLAAVDAGCAAWTNDPNSTVQYQRGGTIQTQPGLTAFQSNDGQNKVLFNDPGNEIPGTFSPTTGGVVAVGGPWFSSAQHTFAGASFNTIVNADVVVQDGVVLNETDFDAVIAHELGHTLGFRHSNEGGVPPITSTALMNSFLVRGLGATLLSWDQEAVSTVYGDAPVCTNAMITGQPLTQTINTGQNASLSVLVTGTSPFSYQWFQGSSGDTSTPFAGASNPTFTTPSLTSTTSFWVSVTNCANASVASTTATITVTCAPLISDLSPSTTVVEGAGTKLTVVATGQGPLTYQWFRGSSGDTSNPVIGATAAGFDTGNLTRSTSYWVRVSGACEPAATSATIVVSVCVPVRIVLQPQDAQITTGQNANLTTDATGTLPLTYRWFRGVSGDTRNPASGGTSTSFNTGALTVTTQFWAQVTNACSSANGSTANVMVVAQCIPPTVKSQPLAVTIAPGQSTTLTASVSGTGLFFQWFRGEKPDASHPVGVNSPSLSTGPLTVTTTYWLQLSNSCGQGSSENVTVTIGNSRRHGVRH